MGSRRRIFLVSVFGGLVLTASSDSFAGIPYAPLSTCRITISQYPARPNCVTHFEPDVIRLCPSEVQVFDHASIDVTVLDALGMRLPNASVKLYEVSGVVNIAIGGSTTAVTDSDGKATIGLMRGSGYGRVGVCADGVLICELAVRSVDVGGTGLTGGCLAMPTTGTSFVNSADKANPSCGFAVKFGPVTPGINDSWDLNCDNFVNSSDTGGQYVPGFGVSGGWLQHFGHNGALGPKSTCP